MSDSVTKWFEMQDTTPPVQFAENKEYRYTVVKDGEVQYYVGTYNGMMSNFKPEKVISKKELDD